MKREYRLTQSNDFKRVRRIGKSYAHPLAIMTVAKGNKEKPRIGIIAARSVGGAVERNHLKRQMRVILTSLLPLITEKADLVFFVREPASHASFTEIAFAVEELLRKAGLIV